MCVVSYHVWALGNLSGVPHCSIVNSWGPLEPGMNKQTIMMALLELEIPTVYASTQIAVYIHVYPDIIH